MIDIYCRDGKCPICRSKLKNHRDDSFHCPNGCYQMFYYYKPKGLIVLSFDDKSYDLYSVSYNGVLIYKMEKQIEERICFWKENDRYLMEILTNDI